MIYSIRNATVIDWDFIQELFAIAHVREQMHAPTQERYLASIGCADRLNLIIERDGQSFGNMLIDVSERWLMTVFALAVREPRQGAGRFALTYAIDLAFKTLGCHRLFLEIVETNVASRRLCEAVGFRPEGLYRDGYRDDSGGFHNLIPYGRLATDK